MQVDIPLGDSAVQTNIFINQFKDVDNQYPVKPLFDGWVYSFRKYDCDQLFTAVVQSDMLYTLLLVKMIH